MWYLLVADTNVNDAETLVTRAAIRQFPHMVSPLVLVVGSVREAYQQVQDLKKLLAPGDEVIVISGYAFGHGSGLEILRMAHRELSAGTTPDRLTLVLHTAAPEAQADIAEFLQEYPAVQFIPKNNISFARLNDLFWQVQNREVA